MVKDNLKSIEVRVGNEVYLEKFGSMAIGEWEYHIIPCLRAGIGFIFGEGNKSYGLTKAKKLPDGHVVIYEYKDRKGFNEPNPFMAVHEVVEADKIIYELALKIAQEYCQEKKASLIDRVIP